MSSKFLSLLVIAEKSVFDFEFCHIHDIGHQPKNGQATLERGTNFDGKHAYDSTDLSMLLNYNDNAVTEAMLEQCPEKSHTKLLDNLDRHSDEQSH